MFKNIKKIITELAKNAVSVAEKELGSGRGQQKKQMAISYILEHMPFSAFLSKFIDDVIENIVQQINQQQKEKGE